MAVSGIIKGMDTAQNPQQQATVQDPDIRDNKDIAALGYVWVLSVFAFFYRPHSAFTRFHARQGMVLFGLSIVFAIVPVIGRFLELAVLALAVIGFLAAAQGQYKELPLIYALSHGDMKGVRRSWQGIVDWIARIWKGMHKTKTTSPSSAAPVPSAQPSAPAEQQTLPSPPSDL
jgi:uncharacterized membrane protein